MLKIQQFSVLMGKTRSVNRQDRYGEMSEEIMEKNKPGESAGDQVAWGDLLIHIGFQAWCL